MRGPNAELGRAAGVRTFLQVLGFVYFVAFASFGIQAPGLIGSRGILPYSDYLATLRTAMGAQAYWAVPTVLWLHPTDAALAAVWLPGPPPPCSQFSVGQTIVFCGLPTAGC